MGINSKLTLSIKYLRRVSRSIKYIAIVAGGSVREQFIECARHLSQPQHRHLLWESLTCWRPPRRGPRCYSGVLRGTQGYSRLCTHGGTPGGQCGAAVFRLLSTVSSANLSHVVNTIISQAATRAWRRDQTGNKVSGCIPYFPHTGDNLVMGSRVRR